MSKILASFAALMIVGAAALPLPASAAEHGISKAQSTELSPQGYWRHRPRHYVRHWGPRRHFGYWGPRRHWGYYGPRRYWGYRHYAYRPYPYRYGYPYGYGYYHRPALAFGVGPFGFGLF